MNRAVARRIMADRDLDDVLQRAQALIASGFNAGSGYPELWIRDFATFMELSCRVHDRAVIRNHLLLLAKFQRDDGDIPDGVAPRDQPPAPNPSADGAPRLTTQLTLAREVITNPLVPDHVGFKISVETDQETSMVQAVATYVRETGDASILHERIYGRTLLDRMEASLDFLLRHRYSERYGLVWGGTTIDWGDVAPEDPIGAVLNGRSHRAVDVYDNAMLLIAIRDLLPLVKADSARVRKWEHVERGIRRNIRKHLWDGAQGKFIPHLYLDGSPFPADFGEGAIWYHGGTAVAIQAGLLSRDEIASSLQAIRLNVRQARGTTLGVTNYPPYPKGLFQNPHVDPGMYQNGGDWDWFGARMVQALTANDFSADAYVELLPIVHRVQRHDGFFEWFDGQDTPRGSGAFRGSAGQIGKAILALRAWAEAKLDGAVPAAPAGDGMRGWGRDGLGAGALEGGARARRALMSTTRLIPLRDDAPRFYRHADIAAERESARAPARPPRQGRARQSPGGEPLPRDRPRKIREFAPLYHEAWWVKRLDGKGWRCCRARPCEREAHAAHPITRERP